MTRPTPEIRVHGQIARVLDGDTVEIEIRRKVKVRILDCWAPETKRTRHPSEKPIGLQARDRMRDMARPDADCVVRILPDGDNEVFDGLSFGRVVGDVWVDGRGWLSDAMVESGLAFRTKAELQAFLTEQDERNHDEI